MPQIPIIIPLIILGLVIGSTLKSESPKISKKKLASTSVVAGLLNSIHAYLLYMLTPAQTITRATGGSTPGGFAVPVTGSFPLQSFTTPTSQTSFIVTSFLAALLIVFLVLGIAKAYGRAGGSDEFEEAGEATSDKHEPEAVLMSS